MNENTAADIEDENTTSVVPAEVPAADIVEETSAYEVMLLQMGDQY